MKNDDQCRRWVAAYYGAENPDPRMCRCRGLVDSHLYHHCLDCNEIIECFDGDAVEADMYCTNCWPKEKLRRAELDNTSLRHRLEQLEQLCWALLWCDKVAPGACSYCDAPTPFHEASQDAVRKALTGLDDNNHHREGKP